MENKFDKRKFTIDLIKYIIYAIFDELDNGVSITNVDSKKIIDNIKSVLISKYEKTPLYNFDNDTIDDLEEINLVTEDIIDMCDPYDIEYYKLAYTCVLMSIKEDLAEKDNVKV